MSRLLMITLLLCLGGCASGSMAQRAVPVPQPTLQDVDQAYVQMVERRASQRGVQVHWIHRPHQARSEATARR